MKVKENDLPVLAAIAERGSPTTAALTDALAEHFGTHQLYVRLCDMQDRGLITSEREPVMPHALCWRLTRAGRDARAAPGIIAQLLGSRPAIA